RRRFLDIMLALSTRGYLQSLQRYRAALTRRNAALREAARAGRVSLASVEVWEPALAEFGATLWSARREWVESVAQRFERLCHDIGEQARVRVRYASAIPIAGNPAAELASALAEKRSFDVRRG